MDLVMSYLPRRYQFSRMDWKLTYFTAAMILSDYASYLAEHWHRSIGGQGDMSLYF